ncbi:hypothetical protein Ndes2437B_g06165 [Nannochloris sp. 'desiccata']
MANDPATKPEAENGTGAAADPNINANTLAPGAKSNGAAAMKSTDDGYCRCLFVYQVLVGYVVEVKVKGGATYSGVFSSLTNSSIILRMARLVRDSNGEAPRSTRPEPKKIIPDGEWYDISAVDVRMGGSDVAAMGAGDDAGGFGTDSAISRGRGGTEGRTLQKWTPDIDEAQLMHLEESVTNTQRGWDQFALNEKKFGVRTDYREELYTTALDPNKSKISMAEAERLAAEIERGNKMDTTNIHLLEERGIEIDDGDMDEEDRYGAVIREAPVVGGVKGPMPPPPPARPAGAWGRGAPGSPAATSAPISIDPRKEANKVRAHMTGGSSGAKAASPYGTPKQLASPLVGDAQKLAALNLNPGMPHVDEDTRRDFEAFKAAQQRSGAGGSAGSLNVSEMKQFSEAQRRPWASVLVTLAVAALGLFLTIATGVKVMTGLVLILEVAMSTADKVVLQAVKEIEEDLIICSKVGIQATAGVTRRPPPPGHARSPPTGGMHMAGPGMPAMMHPGGPMGAPMMMGYLPPGAMPGGVGPRGAQMVYMPAPFMAGGPQMGAVPMRGVPMQMQMGIGYPGGPGMPYHNQGGGGGGLNRGNSGHSNQGGGGQGGDME